MLASELSTHFPRLFHMTYPESWEGIRNGGLISVSSLLTCFEIEGPERHALEGARRAARATLTSPRHGVAVLRDNGPISDSKLAACLDDGITTDEWYRILNARSFFWLTSKRVETLLSAKAYRDEDHVVIVVDTAALVAKHHAAIELSPINSGATVFKAQRRGRDTFQSIAAYDFASWKKKRGTAGAIAELTVKEGVPDLMEFVVEVERRNAAGLRQVIWP